MSINVHIMVYLKKKKNHKRKLKKKFESPWVAQTVFLQMLPCTLTQIHYSLGTADALGKYLGIESALKCFLSLGFPWFVM